MLAITLTLSAAAALMAGMALRSPLTIRALSGLLFGVLIAEALQTQGLRP